jgi:hypothetical protein
LGLISGHDSLLLSQREFRPLNNTENNNEEILKGNDQPTKNHPWLAKDSLAIPGWLHHFPRNPEKLLPKFDPETFRLPKDHIKKFILAIRLMNFQNEDLLCRLFH